MLFTNIHLPIPKGKYETKTVREKDKYLYYRIESWREGKKIKHKRKIVGKIFFDSELKVEYFSPNERYYEINNLPIPDNAIGKKCGRQASIKKQQEQYHMLRDDERLGFGFMIACYSIAKENGLIDILENEFGHTLANKIMAIASFFAAGSPGGMSNIDHFTNKNMCFTDHIITSQNLSNIYQSISNYHRNNFFKQWIKKSVERDYICYDVTSLSNYSNLIQLTEWGYNRDGEKLPQINIGFFSTIKSKTPIYFCEYNGSINDYTNLPYVIEQAQKVGIGERFTLVMDGGFADKKTINTNQLKNRSLIIGAPLGTCHDVKKIVLEWRKNSSINNHNFVNFNNEDIKYNEVKYSFKNVDGRLIMFKSPSTTYDQETSLSNYIHKLEEELSNLKNINKKSLYKYKRFFNIEINSDDTFTFELNKSAYADSVELCGCFALFCTNEDLSCKDILTLYRQKNCVEKHFASYKNDILDERLRVKKIESGYGKLFIAFLGLILRTALKQKLHCYINKSRISLDSAISRLMDIECIKFNNKWSLSKALTKQQKEMIEILNLPIKNLDIAKD